MLLNPLFDYVTISATIKCAYMQSNMVAIVILIHRLSMEGTKNK